ncbi:excisionase family DNA-binding protein [Hydromonas duriensis]|nr:excisionase family DNA-binding protein [Hydromonas duriensis]
MEKTNFTKNQFISTGGVAKRLGLSSVTVQKMVDEGVLAAFKTMGGHRRVLLESVENFERDIARQLSGGGDVKERDVP